MLDWDNRPHPFKEYVGLAAEPLDLESELGRLLRFGAGVIRTRAYPGGDEYHFRTYSSAGALYPVEVYVAKEDGLFHFHPLELALRRVRPEAFATSLVLTGILWRTAWKYEARGYRHLWWDAGTMLANLLALAAAEGLAPRLYTAFVDGEVNDAVGADGTHEYALAVLVLDSSQRITNDPQRSSNTVLLGTSGSRFPLAERAHQASSLSDKDAVRAWRVEPEGEEPTLDRERLAQSMRSRTSIRKYADSPLPRVPLDELLAWSEAPIPADAPRVVQQLVTVAAVEGLDPGIYDASLNLLHARDEQELRERAWFVAMEQDHPKLAAVNVFQLADLPEVVERLGDRGYRWAQLEAGIRAGRLQVGAFMRGWGAAASTFYDEEVSRFLETLESPMLMVAIGPRLRPRPQVRL